MTNLALWKKSLIECRWLLVFCAVFMFGVHWLRVWISSFFSMRDLETMLSLLPEPVEKLLPVTYTQMASGAGQIAAEYDDPVVLLLMTVWAISRGSLLAPLGVGAALVALALGLGPVLILPLVVGALLVALMRSSVGKQLRQREKIPTLQLKEGKVMVGTDRLERDHLHESNPFMADDRDNPLIKR